MRDNDTGDLPGHDSWQPVDHSPIRVNVASLKEYTLLVAKEMDDYTANLKSGVVPMMKVHSTFAGMGEGKLYRDTHAKALKAIGDLLHDLTFSLNSVSQAAAGIYFEYIGGDDLGKAKVEDVYDVFWPSDGRQTVQGDPGAPPADDKSQFTGSASTTDYKTDPPVSTGHPAADTSSVVNDWDKGFKVGDGANAYDIHANQSDMMSAPDDPLKK
jgi:hypothetical protein